MRWDLLVDSSIAKSSLKLGCTTPPLAISCLSVEPSFLNDQTTCSELLDPHAILSEPCGCTASAGFSVKAPSDPVDNRTHGIPVGRYVLLNENEQME